MQITSAHWQLFCCYLLWYSTSSSFRDLIEAWPERIYIPGSREHHIDTDCAQPSFTLEYQLMIHHPELTPAPFEKPLCFFFCTILLAIWHVFMGFIITNTQHYCIRQWDYDCFSLMNIYKRLPYTIRGRKENINHRHPAHFWNLQLSFTLNLEYKRVNYREIIHN